MTALMFRHASSNCIYLSVAGISGVSSSSTTDFLLYYNRSVCFNKRGGISTEDVLQVCYKGEVPFQQASKDSFCLEEYPISGLNFSP